MASGDTNNSGILTAEMLKSLSNEFDIESIHTISLTRRDLNDISVISGCVGMERLDLSYNCISKLYSLSTLTNLLTLDLSGNNLSSLDGLQSLDKLEKLDLSGNYIGSVDILRPLKPLDCLRDLRLHNSVRGVSNPLCMRQNYKQEMCDYMPKLNTLDGEVLKGPNAEVFKMIADLERELADRKSQSGASSLKPVEPPAEIPSDMFSVEHSTDSQLTEVQQQFRESVESCNALSKRSEELIKQTQLKLQSREKV